MSVTRTTNPFEIDFRKKFELTDKVVIITGACGLVGRSFCEAAAQYGAHVVVADIALAEPEKFAAALTERHHRKMLGFALDVSSRKDVEQLKNKVVETFGVVHGLVNAHQNKRSEEHTS